MAPTNRIIFGEIPFGLGTDAIPMYDDGSQTIRNLVIGSPITFSGGTLSVDTSSFVTSSSGGTSGGDLVVYAGTGGNVISKLSSTGIVGITSGVTNITSLGSANQIAGMTSGALNWKTLGITNTGTAFSWGYVANAATVNIPPGTSTNAGTLTTAAQDFAGVKTFIDGLAVSDAKNIALGTTTGTKLGTGTTQKLGFWNVTPIVQPAAANQAALTNSTGGTYDGTLADVGIAFSQSAINNNFTDIYTLLTEIRTALVNAGIMKGAA